MVWVGAGMSNDSMQAFFDSSVLAGGNVQYVEQLFEDYLRDPHTVPEVWRTFFQQLPSSSHADISHRAIQEAFKLSAKQFGHATVASSSDVLAIQAHERKQIRVQHLIQAYRLLGHRAAQIEPLGLEQKEPVSELTIEYHGLTADDLDTKFDVGDFLGARELTLRELLATLRACYCGSIAVEYLHMVSRHEREWIQQHIEGKHAKPTYSAETKKSLLELLTKAEGLEKYIGTKYPGAKRFSLEGGDALLILVDETLRRASRHRVKEAVIGMAHRGRLNVLVNILGKKPAHLFEEFEGKHSDTTASGDVKYHQGFSSDIQTENNTLHLAMAFNPSHLEIVTPVVSGSVRSRMTRRRDTEKEQVLSIAIHGDAAFAGQGVVMETLNMSQTRGYGVGGTIHIIVNNQVGFTTSNPKDARSTLYCSDVAKLVLAPIFHVNADDPEAVLHVARMALDYKLQFKKDVVIDLVCYRRHGHNEADEPSATQPVMYQLIKKHPTARKLYATQLEKAGVIAAGDAEELLKKNRDRLDQGECVANDIVLNAKPELAMNWQRFLESDWRTSAATGIPEKVIPQLAKLFTTVPEGFELHPRVQKIVDDRIQMSLGKLPCDWGFGEMLAYAGLLQDDYEVRITGQDVGRGTFFHRHAVWHCQKTGNVHIPLTQVNPHKIFEIHDSLLSEEAVLAFEYGFASAAPASLVIWEAQFGDFANGAQVVMDQFISSGEQKWGRLCGLVMLLPHGFEGQGPEHSSARLERYLQLCAQHNMQICVPSTPAQVFHMLRRQMIRPVRRPLVVMSPKSLLRHRDAVSTLDEFVNGTFQSVIDDHEIGSVGQVNRVVLCSGKVYYDLLEKKRESKLNQVALVRVEQLYPFPDVELAALLQKYHKARTVIWCQEEPMNQGAWYSTRHDFQESLAPNQTLRYAGRPASASPAVGYIALHYQQQAALVQSALFE